MSAKKRSIGKRREQAVTEASASDFSDDDEAKKREPPKPKESSTKKILVRAGMGLLMCTYYLGMLRGGHMYCILTGVLTQVT